MTGLEREIRKTVSQFAGGVLPFAEFVPILSQLTWELPPEDAVAQRLGYDVELAVAEFTSGHCTEEDLRRDLSRVLGGVLNLETRAHQDIDRPDLGIRVVRWQPQGVIFWQAQPIAQSRATRSRTSSSNAIRYGAVSA